MANIFCSFATDGFYEFRDELCDSAIAVGFDSVVRLSPKDYTGTPFFERNKKILSMPRGAGYWLWKPWLIREVLSMCKPTDLLVYSDAGRSPYYRLRRFPIELEARVRRNGKGFLLGPTIGHHGPLKNWTKRDCLKIMDMDDAITIERPIIQATWSFWTPTHQAFDFLDEWVKYCEDERCLTDMGNSLGDDNYPGFRDHRHDQSILTLLAYKRFAPYIDTRKSILDLLLRMRSRSELANLFLKRIDDGEAFTAGRTVSALLKSFFHLRQLRGA